MTVEAGNVPYRVALPEFEGPLDLLLHLCKTHEIEIVNIPIAFITEKYLEYLELMQNMPVDLAADYLVMLAPLAEHSAWKLIEAFGKILEKAGKKLTHDVVIDRVSISERINQLIDRIE